MKIIRISFLIIAVLISACSKSNEKNVVSYSVSPITIQEQPMLKVNLVCNAEKDGETTLLFLNDTWGEKDLHNTIQEIKPLGEASEVEVLKDSGWITIKHPKNLKTISLEYIIKQDTKGEITTNKTYRPVIQPEYFHVFSHGLFMIPLDYTIEKEDEFDVNINWENFPLGYKLQNSFGTNKNIQNLVNLTQDKFMESVFIGGDYRTHKLDIIGNTVAFSTRGEWKAFKDSTMLDILEKTITAQRDFWKDHSQPYFSVNLTPTVQERGSSFQGTGLTNSFNCSASNNNDLQVEGLVYLFNHELLHNWIGHLIKNENEEEQYWFSEGFTDYYTNKNISKYSIYNLDKGYFIDSINEIIRLLYASPVRDAPNSEINYDNFWSNREYEKLPYRRGALFAFYLDNKIKQESSGKQSLDDLMLTIKADAENGQKISHDYFIKTTNLFLKENVKPFFDTHIENGNLFNLKEIFLDFGFEFEPNCIVFDLGFEFSEDRKSIKSVNDNSEAYKAGLRQGDLIRGMSIYYGSITNEVELTVFENGKEEIIKYLPVREAKIPQLKNTTKNVKLLAF